MRSELLVLVIVSIASLYLVSCKTYYVSTSGNSVSAPTSPTQILSTCSTTSACSVSSLANIVKYLKVGDVLSFKDAVYGPITIDNVVAGTQTNPVKFITTSAKFASLTVRSSKYLQFENFTINGDLQLNLPSYTEGVVIENCSNVVIQYFSITNIRLTGVKIIKSLKTAIRNNTISSEEVSLASEKSNADQNVYRGSETDVDFQSGLIVDSNIFIPTGQYGSPTILVSTQDAIISNNKFSNTLTAREAILAHGDNIQIVSNNIVGYYAPGIITVKNTAFVSKNTITTYTGSKSHCFLFDNAGPQNGGVIALQHNSCNLKATSGACYAIQGGTVSTGSGYSIYLSGNNCTNNYATNNWISFVAATSTSTHLTNNFIQNARASSTTKYILGVTYTVTGNLLSISNTPFIKRVDQNCINIPCATKATSPVFTWASGVHSVTVA